MSDQANVDAVLAALNAALAPREAFDTGKVPNARPAEYVEVLVVRIAGDAPLNLGATTGVAGYRVRVIGISQQSAANVRKSLETCRAALEFKRLTVGAAETTPIQFEAAESPEYADGWFEGYLDLTYAI